MRIRTCLFALSLLVPTLAQAGALRWNLGATSGFTYTTRSVRATTAPGLRPAGFNRYNRPRAQAGTLIPVTQVGRVGGATYNFRNPTMYVRPGSSQQFRQQLGPTIQASVGQQSRSIGGGRRGRRGRRSNRGFRGVRTHGVGASTAGYRFPLN